MSSAKLFTSSMKWSRVCACTRAHAFPRRTSRRLAARRSIRASTGNLGRREVSRHASAYENLNPGALKPTQCVADWARFFERMTLRPTVGCFSEGGYTHLPIPRLVQSIREVPMLPFNIFRRER